MAVYLMCVYGSPQQETEFREAWVKTGKKLDMGKCCIRFKKLEDLPLEVIAEAIKRVPVKKYIALYESAREAVQNRATKGPSKTGKGAKPAKTLKPAKQAKPAKSRSKRA